MAKSPEEMAAAMLQNLPEKTGKPLAEWLTILATSGLAKHGQMVKLLKTEHGVTHGFANLIAHSALTAAAGGPSSEADLVARQYSGPKEALRPIYDALLTKIQAFGDDVEIAPKKSYVSLRRNKQFALIQPSTKTRIDLGINLKGEASGPRLEASGSFNSMVSHRIRLSGPENVDAELVGWLRQAYERA